MLIDQIVCPACGCKGIHACMGSAPNNVHIPKLPSITLEQWIEYLQEKERRDAELS